MFYKTFAIKLYVLSITNISYDVRKYPFIYVHVICNTYVKLFLKYDALCVNYLIQAEDSRFNNW